MVLSNALWVICVFALVTNTFVVTYRLHDFRDFFENISLQEGKDDESLKDLPGNGELFEGDMKMDDRIRDAILNKNKNKKKSAISDESKKWKDGVIVYKIENMDPEGRKLLAKAMAEMELRTCIRFRNRTNEKDYVVYTATEDYCASNVGRIGGRQEINLGKHCHVLGTFLHETMHALGFIHEHSRSDRDDHIKVEWANIKKSDKSNFNKYSLDVTNDYGSAYNFASVMHYRNDAFTNNGKDTIVAKNDPDLHFGQRQKFSEGDVQEINRKYNCKMKNEDYSGLYHNYGEREITKMKDRMRNVRQAMQRAF